MLAVDVQVSLCSTVGTVAGKNLPPTAQHTKKSASLERRFPPLPRGKQKATIANQDLH